MSGSQIRGSAWIKRCSGYLLFMSLHVLLTKFCCGLKRNERQTP